MSHPMTTLETMPTAAVEYRRLKIGEGRPFQEMTFPTFREVLCLNERALAIAAEDASGPVGLALGFLPEDQPEVASLLSVLVAPERRREGIGRELVRRFEIEAVAEGKKTLRATYTTGKPGAEAFERISQREGWGAPQSRMLVIRSSKYLIHEAPWMNLAELPPEMQIIAWKDVTEEEREALKKVRAEGKWVPDDLIPFDYEVNHDPASSVALRFEGAIVGWVVNHPMSRSLVRFTCAYVRPDLQRLGRILWLYAESVRRAEEFGYEEAMWTIPMKHARYIKFAHRWMKPYSTFFGETRGVEKLQKLLQAPA